MQTGESNGKSTDTWPDQGGRSFEYSACFPILLTWRATLIHFILENQFPVLCFFKTILWEVLLLSTFYR